MPSPETKHETVLEATGARARLARVYAEALFALASKAGEGESAGSDLDALAAGPFAAHSRSADFFAHPGVPLKQKQAALDHALADASPLLGKFLGLLNKNRRLELLADIAQAYRKLLDLEAGRVRVTVSSAVEMTSAEQDQLKNTLAAKLGKQPVMALKTDPELLGGLLVQVGDRIYDTTVKARLDSLRNHLLSGTHGA